MPHSTVQLYVRVNLRNRATAQPPTIFSAVILHSSAIVINRHPFTRGTLVLVVIKASNQQTMAYADLATKKTMARLSASLNESAADASHMKQSSFARKQLEKMGWSEGTGLGKK